MPIAPPTHKRKAVGRKHGQVVNRQATRALNTNSKAWRYIRLEILIRDRYTCRDCGRYGNEVDHVDGDSHHNDDANLQTLCHRCHSSKTAKETWHGGKAVATTR